MSINSMTDQAIKRLYPLLQKQRASSPNEAVRVAATPSPVFGQRPRQVTITPAGVFGRDITPGGLARERFVKQTFPGYQPSSLKEANMARTRMNENLAGFDLSGVDLSESILYGTSFEKAKLKGANLDLVRTNFGDDVANFRGADLTNASARIAGFSSGDFTGAQASGIDLSKAELHQANFPQANLYKANLGHAQAENTQFPGADMVGADLRDGNFWGADFGGANLAFADMRGGNTAGSYGIRENTSFAHANFNGANLRYADMRKADVTGADFGKADLSYALLPDLRNAEISGATVTRRDGTVVPLTNFSELPSQKRKAEGLHPWMRSR